MHPNPSFRQTPHEANLQFAKMRGFGVLSVNGTEGPVMAHVPFLLSPDGRHADLHLARANAVVRAGLPAKAVLAVSGADGYVSPDWYGIDDQVPTWNYIAVHLRGDLIPMPPESLEEHVSALSDWFESGLAPKPVWRTSKLSEGTLQRMMRMILPFRLEIGSVDGTWKLNQNKPAEARAGVMAALMGKGGRVADLAQAMRDLDEAPPRA